MSKLFHQYQILKKQNSNILYLFQSGIFYIALEDDALVLSELFKFKLTDLNSHVIKCGFPISKISHYSQLLEKSNIQFQIVSSSTNDDFKISEHNTNSVIQEILNINFDEISFKDAFFKLQNIQSKLKG